ncbi:MAG: ROK family protein [Methanobrevibacter sp.]|uniref:ROK family protein n=1 Tax=Methanobrevibacter sp. TaxID=66852 RepID=UPI0025DB9C49|nr:ROK family protein [Methanobrevibacter sp.]MBQ6138055.1 ROK family protein [Methanobrevibacter sp.]
MNNEKYLAIDIGGTAIKYTLIDKNAENYKIDEIETKKEKEEELYDSLDKIILPHLNEIDGIALSFPGLINVKDGIAHTGGSFKWVHDLPLKSILEERYSKRIWIENDGKCSALAEFWKGNLSNVKNGIVMVLGTGIGGGIILNGQLYRGANGSAGEFSSILTNFKDQNEANRFSKVGDCKSLIKPYAKSKGINYNDIDGREFFEEYHKSDEIAIKSLKDYAKIISAGIINTQCVLDVEKFCIGGGISAQDVLIDEIKEAVHEFFINKTSNPIKEPKIEKCFLENAAGCIGALYNFLNMEKNIEYEK